MPQSFHDYETMGREAVEFHHPGTSSTASQRAALTVADILCHAASLGFPAENVIREAQRVFKERA